MKPIAPLTASSLVVDLDDTLIKTDLLFEQILQVAKSNPLGIWRIPVWALQGKTHLKRQLASAAPLDPRLLPYRQSVLNLVKESKAQGCRVLLASASEERCVRAVAEHLGLFDGAFGSDKVNLKGVRKLDVIQRELGAEPFSYIGDSRSDLPIWAQSQSAVAVNPSILVLRGLKRLGPSYQVIRDRKSLPLLLLRQMRVHQWVKNLLIFAPLLAGHFFLSPTHWIKSILAFIGYCLLASSVYVLNDLLDIESDRRHPRKSARPLAAGDLPIPVGMAMFPILLLCVVLTAAALPLEYGGLLLAYFVINLAYSFRLKKVLVLDVVILAALYTLRILAGGAAAEIPVSQWLLAFSVFFFFGLAMVKRFTEIARSGNKARLHGRGYHAEDREIVSSLGTASSFISILVLVLYLNGEHTKTLYSHPERLWLITPVLLYWTARLWILTHRNQVHDDPVVFAIKDRVSWIALGCLGVVIFISI